MVVRRNKPMGKLSDNSPSAQPQIASVPKQAQNSTANSEASNIAPVDMQDPAWMKATQERIDQWVDDQLSAKQPKAPAK